MSLAHGPALTAQLGDFNPVEFLDQVAHVINEVFPHAEGWLFEDPKHRSAFEKEPKKAGFDQPYGYIKKDSNEAVLSAAVNVYRMVNTSVGGYYGNRTFHMMLDIKVKVVEGEPVEIALYARDSGDFSDPFKRHNERGAKDVLKVSKAMQYPEFPEIKANLEKAKKAFMKDQAELEKKLKTSRADPMNAIHSLKPTLEVEPAKQTMMFRKFGMAVEALVKKYSVHDAESKSQHAGYYGAAELRHGISGKIEFADQHTHHGGHYGITRGGRFAVKLGSGYPKDQATAFLKEYIKLVQKQLPVEIPVRAGDKTEQRKVHIHVADGTSYKTIMVTF